jgi:hypothetical protein
MTFTMDRISGLKMLKALPVTSQLLLGTLIFLVLIWIVKFFLSRPKRLNFPVIETSPTDYKSALLEGTLKVSVPYHCFSFHTHTHLQSIQIPHLL